MSLLILAIVVVAAALARSHTGRRITASLGVSTQQEPYTAVAFEHPADVGDVGARYRGSQVSETVSFSITNLEHRPIAYRWRVFLQPDGQTYAGSVALASGREAVISPRVVLPCAAARHRSGALARRVQVRVTVQPSGDSIDFWQQCGG